ncbi:hypothetical protein [Sorangium sp. So ce124]|uniref:hypothetical protein n=1 Tax=Sorangium sp. So ce124 TaxID=3133280 RepID=UPI003F648268
MSTPRWDETWHRLREWTFGQGPSERLAAQMLLADGFSNLDPSHPLGGKDGGKDALCIRAGQLWAMAVYFPRGQQSFAEIRKKFAFDLVGARANGVDGLAFVTNQELSLSERKQLNASAAPTAVELYHLERITTLLDSVPMAATRKQFLGIDHVESTIVDRFEDLRNEMLANQKRLEAMQTGGDSFCYFMLYYFDLANSIAQNFAVIRKGEFPLYDVRMRVVDMDTSRNVFERPWGEINAPAQFLVLKWSLASSVYYRAFFSARNGAWHQDLILKRSKAANCWLAATRVLGRNGRDVIFLHIDGEYLPEFGEPSWKS